ncbi:MAG: T9SS type A sorting domain-containing protein [Saprospiraceae bacterium]|nr:T9SS type A sorting domain-containing protein [Saprospiraceae bacterium]
MTRFFPWQPTLFISFLFLLFVENEPTYTSKSVRLEPAHETQSQEKSKMRLAGERMEQEFRMTRIPGTNIVPRDRLIRARAVAKRSRTLRSSGLSLNWEERGPSNVAGRTRAILVDANDTTHNTIFAGGVAGGLWKTTNFKSATPTWSPIDDFFDNIAISAIIQDPADPDIIYFGTGEGWFNIDAVRGLGIWKTTDGGTSWSQLPSTSGSPFQYIQDLIIDSNGSLYASTRDRGLMRSTDGGTSWSSVLSGYSVNAPTNRASDLELGADGSIYAAMGIFSSGRIYKSDVSEGVNLGDLSTWTDISPADTFHRIEIATAPSNADRLYAICQGNSSYDVTSMFRSDNGGSTWTSISVPGFCDAGNARTVFTRGQAWYDLISAVDPNHPDTIFIGGVDALRSLDGGVSWSQISGWAQDSYPYCSGLDYIHADHHKILYLGNSSDEMIWGTDGGISYTTNATNTFPTFTNKNSGYNITQFYSAALHPDSAEIFFLGGTQDNGSHRFTSSGINATVEVSGGDGGFCHIDQNNPDFQITSYVRNNYYYSNNGGASFQTIIRDNSGLFINPTDYDNDAGKLYAASNSGQYLRWDNPRTVYDDPYAYGDYVNHSGNQITAVFCDPNVDHRVWFGGYGSGSTTKLIKIDSAHLTDSTIVETIIPVPADVSYAYISSFDILKGRPDQALVTFSNYGAISVWLVKNLNSASPNWSNIEGNLPDMPVRWGMFSPVDTQQALLATELGVWSTELLDSSSTVWVATNSGLANVRVDMLQYRESDGLLLAATHGRGMFTANLGTPTNECPPETAFLSNLYASTNGSNWINPWDTTSCTPCNWYGVGCDSEGNITSINLSGNNLTGTLPSSLSGLGMLDSLNLSNNSLTGCFPTSYSSFCGQLNQADFSNNKGFLIPNGEFDIFCALGSSACTVVYTDTCITSVEYLMLDDPFITSGSYQASDSITLTGDVETGDSVFLVAGQQIIFKPGFHALPGSFVHAQIMPCSPPEPPVESIPSPMPIASSEREFTPSSGQMSLQVWPNPFQEQTQIRFVLPEKTKLKLQVFSPNGQLISQPFHGQLRHAGSYQLQFSGHHLPPGIYVLVLETNGQRKIARMVKL